MATIVKPKKPKDPNQPFAQAITSAYQSNAANKPFANAIVSAYYNRPGVPAPGAAPAAPPAPDARDSGYFGDVAKAQHQRDQTISGLNQQGAYDTADVQEALRRLGAQRPQDESSARVGANKQGLFYSSTLGNKVADIATSYSRQEGDINSAFTRREADREAARQAALTGYTDTEGDALRAAISRAVGSDTQAADAGALAPPTAAGAPAGDVVTAHSDAHGGRLWQYRKRPSDGKLIPIGPA